MLRRIQQIRSVLESVQLTPEALVQFRNSCSVLPTDNLGHPVLHPNPIPADAYTICNPSSWDTHIFPQYNNSHLLGCTRDSTLSSKLDYDGSAPHRPL